MESLSTQNKYSKILFPKYYNHKAQREHGKARGKHQAGVFSGIPQCCANTGQEALFQAAVQSTAHRSTAVQCGPGMRGSAYHAMWEADLRGTHYKQITNQWTSNRPVNGCCPCLGNCFLKTACYCCCSATNSRATLCDPVDCSTPGSPVLHHLPEFAQIHIHWVSDTIQPSHPLSSPSPLALNLPQHQGLFQWVSSSGGQSVRVSASVPVLPYILFTQKKNCSHSFSLNSSFLIVYFKWD